MATSWPKKIGLQVAAEQFAKNVEAMSGGRLVIKVYPGGALMSPMEVFDSVHMGTIDAGHTAAGYRIGKEAAAALFFSIPAGFEAIPFLTWIYEGGGLELWQEMNSKYNIGYSAPCGILPPEDFAWSHKPIRTLEDFKGLKMRAAGYWGEILNDIGASTVTLPAQELYPALQRKVLDALEFNMPSTDKILGFYEITEYLIVPGVHQPSSVIEITVNKKSWEKLPPDLQAIVKIASQATTLRLLTQSVWLDAPALEFFKKYGTEIIYLDPKVQKELAKKANVLLDKYAKKDPFFAKVLTSQRKWKKAYLPYKHLMTPAYD